MRRRAARQTTASVSLFPFLAVLVCTMGALIVLLVVISRQSRAQAAEAVNSRQAASDEELEIQGELLELRISQLTEQRRKTEADLILERRRLSHVEDHARRLRDELAALNSATGTISSRAGNGAPTEELRFEVAHLKRDLADASRRLEEARRSRDDANRTFAVIPFQGPHETSRRPLYIECQADAIILQPEGIKLTEKDFQGPLGPGNPLAAALRAASEYLTQRAAASPDYAGDPYPLLLVRPAGILAYYVARASLKSWGSEFGYELIEEDWNLEFEPPDPQLAEIQRRAVERARTIQQRLARIAPRRFGRGQNRSFHADADEQLLPETPGLGGDGGAGGSRVGDDAIARQDRDFGPHGQGRFAASADSHHLGGGHGGTGHGSTREADADWPYDSMPLGTAGDRSAPAEPVTGAPTAIVGGPGGTPLGRMNGSPGSNEPDHATGRGPTPAGAMPGPGDSQAAGGLLRANSPSQAQGSGSRSAGGAAGGTAGLGHQRTSAASGPGGGSPQSGPGRPGKASSSRVGGHGAGNGSAAQQYGAAAQQQATSTLSMESNVRSLAQERGRDWGLPAGARRAVPITRPIKIICAPDRLIVLSDDGEPEAVIRFAGRTEGSIDDLVSTLWDHVDGWGIAGKRMYWRPVLAVEVAPDGEARFAALATLLDGSGLDVKRRGAVLPTQRLPGTPVEKLPGGHLDR